MDSEFCIRNFLCEHSQETPGPLDDVAAGRKNKLPVFHIYGVTDTGKKACLHVHGVLPYLMLRVGGRLTPAVFYAMRAKINRCIQREIEVSTGNVSKYQSDYVYKMESVTSRPIYGYQEEEEEFVRVFFPSPWYLQKATAALGREVLQKSVFQPFEAHLPFHLQFFIDNSIFGMDNIFLSKVKYRISSLDSDDLEIYKGLKIEDVRNNPTLLSPLERISTCFVECDAHYSDILNVRMHSKNVHSSNPGLEYIWREEKERCDAQGIEMVDVFNSYEPRKSTIWPQERDMLKKAKQIAKSLRTSRNMSTTLDDMMQTQIFDSQVAGPSGLDCTFWEDPEDATIDGKVDEDQDPDKKDDDENLDNQDNEEAEQEQEFEMSQKVGNDVDQEAESSNQSKSRCGKVDVIEIGDSDDESEKLKTEKLQWVTARSAFHQKYIEYGKATRKTTEEPVVRKPFSREMTSCSVLTEDDTIMGMEVSQTLEPSKFLSQTSMEETVDASEQSGESDIVGLCTASLELLVKTSKPMPDFVTDRIICASLSIFDDVCRESSPKVHILLTILNSSSINNMDKRVEVVDTEAEIMERIVELVVKFDVDVMVGYDTMRLSWGYLLRRSGVVGVKMAMDRLKTPDNEEYGNHQQQNQNPYERIPQDDQEALPATPKGRLLVAVWKVVKSDLTLRSYDLGTAISQVLRRKIAMLDNCALTKRIETGNFSEVFTHLLKLSRVNISLLIEMNWFLKNAEMARVYGIQFHEVWTRGSQLRVESMLLRLARKMNFLAPSVTQMQRNLMSAPEQLQLILEPQSKVYFDPVIVLDFQSLYPSMVIAYNYCYSTILGKIAHLQHFYNEESNFEEIVLGAVKYQSNKENLVKLVAHKEVIASPLASLFVKKSTREGVLPTLLREILSARIMVKNAMKRAKSKKLKRILDARQLALKLVANVSYGYTAANWSGRMPLAELADAILGKGRETLERAIDMVQKGSYGGSEVIYGDTDSMFVLVKGATVEQAFEIGRRIASDVTDANPDPVVLKLEKVYKGCVLETKKRYAGWMYEHENDTPQLDAKGIETVRRDTAPIVAEVLEKSLEMIFTRKWKMLFAYLNRTAMTLPKMNFTKFMFCKEFRGEYSKKAMVPQKKIAEKRFKMCKSYVTLRGERVPYIIVDGSPGSTVYSCVRTIEEYAKNPNLRINVNYYLNAHILAALRRVTSLLPMNIELLSLHSDQCFSLDCTRLGQSPWCIKCQRIDKELAAGMIQIGRETRALSGMREICRKCQSSSNRLPDSSISECSNFSCLVKQTCTMMDRANTINVVKAHKMF